MAQADLSPAKVWAAALAVAERTPRWHVTSADEPRYIEGVATTLVLRFRVRAPQAQRQICTCRACRDWPVIIVLAELKSAHTK